VPRFNLSHLTSLSGAYEEHLADQIQVSMYFYRRCEKSSRVSIQKQMRVRVLQLFALSIIISCGKLRLFLCQFFKHLIKILLIRYVVDRQSRLHLFIRFSGLRTCKSATAARQGLCWPFPGRQLQPSKRHKKSSTEHAKPSGYVPCGYRAAFVCVCVCVYGFIKIVNFTKTKTITVQTETKLLLLLLGSNAHCSGAKCNKVFCVVLFLDTRTQLTNSHTHTHIQAKATCRP